MMGDLAPTPLLPWPAIVTFAVISLGLSGAGVARGGAGALWRLFATFVIIAALLDPRLVREVRDPQSDVVLALVDRTASQSIGERRARTSKAVAHLHDQLKRFPETELRVATVSDPVSGPATSADGEGTLVMRGLRHALRGVPAGRLSGVVVISSRAKSPSQVSWQSFGGRSS